MAGIEARHGDRGVARGRAAEARAVRVAVRLAAAHAVHVGDAAHGPVLPRQPAGRAVDQLLELGQGEHAVDAIAELTDFGLVAVEAGGHDDRADPLADRPGSLAADPDLHLVVAEAAGLAHDLGARQDGDGRSCLDGLHEACDELAAVAIVRVDGTEPAHPAAQRDLALHDHDAEADVREPDRRAQPGDAAADDQRAGHGLHHERLVGGREPGARDARPDQAGRLPGRGILIVGMDPGALLPDVRPACTRRG